MALISFNVVFLPSGGVARNMKTMNSSFQFQSVNARCGVYNKRCAYYNFKRNKSNDNAIPPVCPTRLFVNLCGSHGRKKDLDSKLHWRLLPNSNKKDKMQTRAQLRLPNFFLLSAISFLSKRGFNL